MAFRKATTALTHASYVFGLTFFSTLSTNFIDQIITGKELTATLWAAFIASGISFFGSMAIQGKMQQNYARNGNDRTLYAAPDTTQARISKKRPKKKNILHTGIPGKRCKLDIFYEAMHGKESGGET